MSLIHNSMAEGTRASLNEGDAAESRRRVPPPDAVRGLHEELEAVRFGEWEAVSPEQRPLMTLPRELVRRAMLPDAPDVAQGSVFAARRMRELEARSQSAGALFRLLTVGEAFDAEKGRGLLPARIHERLLDSGIVTEKGREWRASLRVVPIGGAFVITDFVTARAELGNDYVQFGLDSALLARMIVREARGGGRALDLCTGGGIQALMLARSYAQVEASDVNARALALAKANAALNGVEGRVQFRRADLYEGASGLYDLIVANPPFMFLPDELAATQLTGYGGALGIQITLRILEGLEARLAPGGEAFIYTQAPRIAGRCALVDATRQRLGSGSLRFEFEEILRGYWSPFREFYRANRVEWLTCYRLRVRRADAPGVSVRPLRGWRRAAAALAVLAERGR